MTPRTYLRLTSVVAAIGMSAVAAVLVTRDDELPPVPVHRMVTATVSTDDLATADRVRVFFEHQSVGGNLLDAVPGLYAERGLPAPTITDTTFGQNGDPMAKIVDFDARIRGGIGREVDVALMKLCYVDVNSDTDVDAVFEQYRSTLAGLERDFPDVTFLHATTPVTTDPGWKSKVKKWLGRDPHLGPADNVARERLNALMRAEYPADRLFDLAKVESTAPDGSRSSGRSGGHRYFSLYPGYAADPGHLNEAGAALAAAHLLRLIADSATAERA